MIPSIRRRDSPFVDPVILVTLARKVMDTVELLLVPTLIPELLLLQVLLQRRMVHLPSRRLPKPSLPQIFPHLLYRITIMEVE